MSTLTDTERAVLQVFADLTPAGHWHHWQRREIIHPVYRAHWLAEIKAVQDELLAHPEHGPVLQGRRDELALTDRQLALGADLHDVPDDEFDHHRYHAQRHCEATLALVGDLHDRGLLERFAPPTYKHPSAGPDAEATHRQPQAATDEFAQFRLTDEGRKVLQ